MTPVFVTAKDIAKYTGMSIPTIYQWVQKGIIPKPRKPNRGVRIWEWSEVQKALGGAKIDDEATIIARIQRDTPRHIRSQERRTAHRRIPQK